MYVIMLVDVCIFLLLRWEYLCVSSWPCSCFALFTSSLTILCFCVLHMSV